MDQTYMKEKPILLIVGNNGEFCIRHETELRYKGTDRT